MWQIWGIFGAQAIHNNGVYWMMKCVDQQDRLINCIVVSVMVVLNIVLHIIHLYLKVFGLTINFKLFPVQPILLFTLLDEKHKKKWICREVCMWYKIQE